jgi:hypothetical protein
MVWYDKVQYGMGWDGIVSGNRIKFSVVWYILWSDGIWYGRV